MVPGGEYPEFQRDFLLQISEAEGHLVGWCLGSFFTIVLTQDLVCFGEDGGVVVGIDGHVFDLGCYLVKIVQNPL